MSAQSGQRHMLTMVFAWSVITLDNWKGWVMGILGISRGTELPHVGSYLICLSLPPTPTHTPIGMVLHHSHPPSMVPEYPLPCAHSTGKLLAFPQYLGSLISGMFSNLPWPHSSPRVYRQFMVAKKGKDFFSMVWSLHSQVDLHPSSHKCLSEAIGS